ncbi:MAG TPA: amidohydrolase family protein [Dehalococcoidia bacterium]|nr:amidohydrolase family protein [Dehalococcoidia bacterium]
MPDAQERWRIDVHHHVLPPQYVSSTPMPVRPPDVDTQLEIMQRLKIRVALISLTPRVLDAHADRLEEVARTCNEFQAELVRDNPAHFGAFAVLPLPKIDASLKEIAYSLDVLHLDGVGLFSSSQGQYLGDSRLDPVFDELQRRKVAVLIHPAHCVSPEEWNLQIPDATLEYCFDTTRAIVNMLYSGTLKRCPDIQMILSHGGGTLPYLITRVSMLARYKLPNLMETAKSLYFDVATTGACALRSLQELADPTRILWGSDLPFVSPERLAEELESWEAYDGLDEAGRDAVEHGNALRLFPRFAAVPSG